MSCFYRIIFCNSPSERVNKISEESSGKLGSLSVITMANKCTLSKNWYIAAIIVSSFIVIGPSVGVGSFGIVGLFQSHGIISLPQSFHWLTSAIGTIGHTPRFWSLWGISVGGLAMGLGGVTISGFLIGFGIPTKSKEGYEQSEDSIQPFQHIRIRSSQFSRIPPKETFQQDLDYDLKILMAWFDEECPAGEYRTEFNSMITNISERNAAILEAHMNLPPSFYDDMTLYLNNIIQALSENPERKKQVLSALADAANVCPPTWYETAKKQLKLLRHPNNGEAQLLLWIQEIKEEIILELSQGVFDSQWHALNYARYHVGKELGLNREGLENDQYFPRKIVGQFSKQWMINIVKENLTIERLVTAIEIKVNAEYQVCFYEMLKAFAIELEIEESQANNYVAEHFYEDDCVTVNQEGIVTLLKGIGYLSYKKRLR